MSDIVESALILLGILMEEGATGSRQLTAGELCAKSGLSPDEFDQADSFLLNGRYVEGTMGGDKGRRWLTSDGINYYQTQIADRYPLSQMAKRAAKLIMTKTKTDRDEVSGDKICAELEIDRETYVQTMRELADSGLIQEPIQVQQPGFSFSGVNLTTKGRRAVRSNFKRERIAPVQQIGAIFQEPVNQNRIQEREPQLLLNPIFSGRGFYVEDDLCFVLMPFAPEDLQAVYQDFVKPTVERAGLRCLRADDIFGASAIIEDIWAGINRARFVIAELTGRNPNVFYEVGICHTVGKDVIFLARSIEDIPFDLRHLRVLLYDYTPRGCQRLAEALHKTILAVTGRSVEPTA